MSSESTVTGVAGRYATALFELAEAQNALDAVATDLGRLQAALDASVDLRLFVKSPLYAAEDQARVISAILDKVGVGGLVRNFVGVVIQNRRLFVLASMLLGYRQLLARKRGEITADVTSAHALSDAQIADLTAALKDATKLNVNINTNVDESLLGGLIVKVGSRMIDSSLRTKLNSLKNAMKEAG